MNKVAIQQYVTDNLQPNDELIESFLAIKRPNMFYIVLFSWIAIFSLRYYVIAVSQRGIYFHKLNFFGRFSSTELIEYQDIEHVTIGLGFVQKTFHVYFKNGRQLKLKAAFRGARRGLKITHKSIDFLSEKVMTLR